MNFAVVLFCCLIVRFSFADDDDCQKQTRDVFECLRKKHEDNKDADDKKIEQVKTKITKCFTDKKCKGPDFEKITEVRDPMTSVKFQEENTPKAVKDCLEKNFINETLHNVNDCLNEQNVKTIKENEIDHLDIDGENRTRTETDGRLMRAAVAVAAALKRCEKDTDTNTKDAVVKCVKPIREDATKEMCKRINDCKDDAKLSDSCRKREKEVKQALCKCKENKFAEAKSKIEKLQKTGDEVDAEELEKAMPEGLKIFNVENVKKCYADNNVPVPAMILAFELTRSEGPLGLKPKITQSQLQTAHDFLDDEIKAHHCGCDA